jgi:hypothetical protein
MGGIVTLTGQNGLRSLPQKGNAGTRKIRKSSRDEPTAIQHDLSTDRLQQTGAGASPTGTGCRTFMGMRRGEPASFFEAFLLPPKSERCPS